MYSLNAREQLLSPPFLMTSTTKQITDTAKHGRGSPYDRDLWPLGHTINPTKSWRPSIQLFLHLHVGLYTDRITGTPKSARIPLRRRGWW